MCDTEQFAKRMIALTSLHDTAPYLFNNNPHILCGGNKCNTNDPHCNHGVLIRKNTDEGYTTDNCIIVCCFVADALNRGWEKEDFKNPKTICPCGSGKKLMVCANIVKK